MVAESRPQSGSLYRSPINVIGTRLADINNRAMGVRIDNLPTNEKGEEVWPVLGLIATDADPTWELLYVKMEMYITGLSIGTVTHCWLSDYIYDENGKEVWRKPRTIAMVVDKEGDPLSREDTSPNMTSFMTDLTFHISRHYPRVFLYHYIGLLLLRTPLVGHDLNREILLNFFKIAELVTATRTDKKATLKVISLTSRELYSHYNDSRIKEFWIVRSRDAAHDHRQAQNVSRELATDCKLFAEELIFRDWQDRR